MPVNLARHLTLAPAQGTNSSVGGSPASTSGFLQFIEQTWLATLKDAGPGLGYGKYADAITMTASGKWAVADPAMCAEIAKLQHDPTASSLMARAFTAKNAALLWGRVGPPSEGERSVAHFLGAFGATKLIAAAAQGSAAGLFPKAARARRSGGKRSVAR
jgi:hypothetical protein